MGREFSRAQRGRRASRFEEAGPAGVCACAGGTELRVLQDVQKELAVACGEDRRTCVVIADMDALELVLRLHAGLPGLHNLPE